MIIYYPLTVLCMSTANTEVHVEKETCITRCLVMLKSTSVIPYSSTVIKNFNQFPLVDIRTCKRCKQVLQPLLQFLLYAIVWAQSIPSTFCRQLCLSQNCKEMKSLFHRSILKKYKEIKSRCGLLSVLLHGHYK